MSAQPANTEQSSSDSLENKALCSEFGINVMILCLAVNKPIGGQGGHFMTQSNTDV